MDDYLATLDRPTRETFERIRRAATEVAPEVGQGTSYSLAALMYEGKPLLGFLAAKHHLSVFPFSSAVVDGVRDRLPDFDLSKGTIRFTVEKPLPDDVVCDIVRHRIAEIEHG